MEGNIPITKGELKLIRNLGDFDLAMVLSEINENGWESAKVLLPLIAKSLNVELPDTKQ